jgi:hypothetical protein
MQGTEKHADPDPRRGRKEGKGFPGGQLLCKSSWFCGGELFIISFLASSGPARVIGKIRIERQVLSPLFCSWHLLGAIFFLPLSITRQGTEVIVQLPTQR